MKQDGGQARRFTVAGDIDLATVPALEAAVAAATAEGGDVTLDMHGVNFIDSSGIAGLVRISKRLGSRGRLVVIAPEGMPLRTLRMVGVDRVDGLTLLTEEDERKG